MRQVHGNIFSPVSEGEAGDQRKRLNPAKGENLSQDTAKAQRKNFRKALNPTIYAKFIKIFFNVLRIGFQSVFYRFKPSGIP